MARWEAFTILNAVFAVVQGLNYSFPAGFRFGAATAAYQIEGAWNASDKSPSAWDTFSHTSGRIADGSTGDVACNSYELWRRDVEMLRELGVHFYRFSISWPRILPNGFPTRVSEDGARYYGELIDGLIEAGIEPMVTIFHWDLPQNLQDLGGWTNPLVVEWFADYARVVYSLYGDRVRTWITINEPIALCGLGYSFGVFAPGIVGPDAAEYLCNKYVLLAHARAWRIYDEEFRPLYHGKVSIASHFFWYESYSPADDELTVLTREYGYGLFCSPIFSKEGGWPPAVEAKIAEVSRAEGWPRSKLPTLTPEEKALIKGTFDYFAVNQYTSRLVRALRPGEVGGAWPLFGVPELGGTFDYDPAWSRTQTSWLWVNPVGIRHVLNWIRDHYGNPEILITENGYPSQESSINDQDRVDYHKAYLEQVLLAIHEDGVRVSGYTAWSLMDNFEWGDGLKVMFGLYAVDFSSSDRTRSPRHSALYYASVVKAHALDV